MYYDHIDRYVGPSMWVCGSKFHVQVEDSCRSRGQTVREWHIHQQQLTLNSTYAKKPKLQRTQQKREEPN